MKISKCWENNQVHSGKLSDLLRQAALAGIALIWIFKEGDNMEGFVLPERLIISGALIFTGLFLDALQYLTLSALWHRFAYLSEKTYKKEHPGEGREGNKKMANTEVAPWSWINELGYFLFYVKSVVLLAAFALLVAHLWLIVGR